MVSQFSGHLVDDLFENHRVDVLSQHVQQEPVPHLCLLDDDVDALLLDQPEPDVEQVGPYSGGEDDEDSVDDDEEGEKAEEEEPEPDENVDLLIHYINWQNAHGIVLLYFSTGTKLVKCTFCHPGKNINHGVYPILLVPLCK